LDNDSKKVNETTIEWDNDSKKINNTNSINKNIYTTKKAMEIHRFYLYYYEVLIYFADSWIATAQATVAPTIGLLPIPISPIIST